MATEIPMQVKFNQLLSHTFPGFFSAITFLMLIDVWSPLNLTFLISSDTTRLIAFIGLIFVMGTIFGIINDGLHHSIIEDIFFDRSKKIIKIKSKIREAAKIFRRDILCMTLPCSSEIINCINCAHYDSDCPLDEFILDHYYVYGENQDQIMSIDIFLNEEFYCYSEFYANTFLSLVPFSIVLPFYLSKFVQMDGILALILGGIIIIFAGICIYSSYYLYFYYYQVLYSLVRGHVDSLKI
jgi:hypothetical protein